MRASTISATGLFLSLAMLGAIWPAEAAVQVNFVSAERFADVDSFNESTDATLADIRQYLVRLGNQYLPPGQTLEVDILDVDLAGSPGFVGSTWENVRVVDGQVDWPRLRVHYVLQDHDRVVASRDETISGMNYLWREPADAGSEPLSHEKQMLKDWFRRRFARNGSPGR